jgi:DNA-binding LytR/AlgR family response regulator
MSNKQLRYLIVDDEPIAHRIIEDYCAALPHLVLAKHCYNALEAVQYLSSNKVDLMFLDLNMPKLKGFDFLKTLAIKPKVIVTSAYQEFALEGYELDVSDYLLKPFSFERFLKAINKTIIFEPAPFNETLQVSPAKNIDEKIFIKGDKGLHQIALNDINYIEACGNYCLVFLKDKKIITHQKISQFESDLPSDDFMRVHKSYIASKAKIESISAGKIIIDQKQLPIGQTYKEKVNQYFRHSQN